jgi:diphosphomevalonate decarboxylase
MPGTNTEMIKVSWRCPSNIAIVKYWGKKENQLPCNASVSMTLTNSFTEIDMHLSEKKSNEEIALNYFFEGKKNEQFEQRLLKYLISVRAGFPFLRDWGITIHSKNSFPHSAGIASSASAFGALALCLCDLSYNYFQGKKQVDFLQHASRLARLGSGSACRSIYPGFAFWGSSNELPGSSDEFAVPITGIHQNFKELQDAILIIEKEPKKVSSSAGHALMKDHPFANNRFAQANQRASRMLKVLSTGDWEEFIYISESEALTLHAMMLTSKDYYLLMKPGTLTAIEKITNFRNDTKIPVCFTLDAGPNLHVLYPASDKHAVNEFLKNDLRICVEEIILDKLGKGPEKIKS